MSKQKRTRAQAQTTENRPSKANGTGAENRDRASEASDQVERESSPEDDFEDAPHKTKRNRASDGTSALALKSTDQSLIGNTWT